MAERRTKKSETSEHNTGHKNEQTPDRRAKAKAKTGPSRPENRAKAKAKTGSSPKKLVLLTYQQCHHFLQEVKINQKNNNPGSEHEPKGKQGRPRNNQGPPPVKKDRINKEKQHQTQDMTLT